MAGSLNKVTLIGNVGQDPVIQTFPDGNKMAKFSLCTSEKWTNKKTNEKMNQVEWHKIVVNVQGMIPYIETYVRKGCQLYVEGIIKSRPYNKDGVEKVITEIHLKGLNHTLLTLNFTKKEESAAAEHTFDLDDTIDF